MHQDPEIFYQLIYIFLKSVDSWKFTEWQILSRNVRADKPHPRFGLKCCSLWTDHLFLRGRGGGKFFSNHFFATTVEPPLTATSIMATSLQQPGFFIPTVHRSIHFTLIETSLQWPPLYDDNSAPGWLLWRGSTVSVLHEFPCTSFQDIPLLHFILHNVFLVFAHPSPKKKWSIPYLSVSYHQILL